MFIELSKTDLAQIKELATLRHGNKKGSKRFTARYSEIEIGEIGLMGELAFSKRTGLQLDTEIYRGGDAGYDFIYNSKRWEIKTRKGDPLILNQFDLLVGVNEPAADYYVLAIASINNPMVQLVGYCNRSQLIQSTINLGYGERYIVRAKDLQIITS